MYSNCSVSSSRDLGVTLVKAGESSLQIYPKQRCRSNHFSSMLYGKLYTA